MYTSLQTKEYYGYADIYVEPAALESSSFGSNTVLSYPFIGSGKVIDSDAKTLSLNYDSTGLSMQVTLLIHRVNNPTETIDAGVFLQYNGGSN
jgi:hypothetical protein